MLKKVVFMSGLPRSGSTLLMNILAQNPHVQPSGTSGLFEIVQGMRNQYTQSVNIKAQPEEEMDTRFKECCKAAIRGWCEGDKEIYIEKSRAWPQFFEFLQNIGMKPYMIVTVRDLRPVLASMEKLYRKNSLRVDPVAGLSTTEARVKQWGGGVPVGEAANQIQDLFTRGLSDQVIFVKYEDLVQNPQQTLSKIYSYIDEDTYLHDFANVEQVTVEDDRLHGIPDLHNIRSAVSIEQDDWNEVLGSDLSQAIVKGAPWFYEKFYNAKLGIPLTNEGVISTTGLDCCDYT